MGQSEDEVREAMLAASFEMFLDQLRQMRADGLPMQVIEQARVLMEALRTARTSRRCFRASCAIWQSRPALRRFIDAPPARRGPHSTVARIRIKEFS